MSERNGDRARFHKNRKRKLLHRQRLRTLLGGDPKLTAAGAGSAAPDTTQPKRRPARQGG